jgi:hypothetical protein
MVGDRRALPVRVLLTGTPVRGPVTLASGRSGKRDTAELGAESKMSMPKSGTQ